MCYPQKASSVSMAGCAFLQLNYTSQAKVTLLKQSLPPSLPPPLPPSLTSLQELLHPFLPYRYFRPSFLPSLLHLFLPPLHSSQSHCTLHTADVNKVTEVKRSVLRIGLRQGLAFAVLGHVYVLTLQRRQIRSPKDAF